MQAKGEKKQIQRNDKLQTTIKMFLESQKETLAMVLGSTTKGNSGLSEEDKLDQEDQRIKEVELGKLGELNENASIACGDWIHRIRPAICILSKRAKTYWALVEKIVDERYISRFGGRSALPTNSKP